MKISVVTISYNAVESIADTISSVQKQNHPNVEHVIIDGASKDGTVELIRRLADERTIIVSEPDKGLYDALNKGIARSTGDVIGLMHSDDIYASDCVLAKVASVFSDPGIDGVYGDLQYVAADDLTRVIRHWQSGTYDLSKLRRGWMPPHPTLYLRREVFERWGVYDAEMRIAADYDAMLRYLVKGGITLCYIPEVMVKMRIGGVSNRSLRQILHKSREDLVAMRRNGVGGIGTLVLKNLRKLSQFIMQEGTRA